MKTSHRFFKPFNVILKNDSWDQWMVEWVDGGNMLWWENRNSNIW